MVEQYSVGLTCEQWMLCCKALQYMKDNSTDDSLRRKLWGTRAEIRWCFIDAMVQQYRKDAEESQQLTLDLDDTVERL